MLDVRFREKFQDALAQGCNIVRAELGLPPKYIAAADPALQIDIVPKLAK